MDYAQLKDLITAYSGLEKDAIHIHVALLLYILALWMFRQSRRSRLPWLFVLLIELGNETYDLVTNWTGGPEWAMSEAGKDLWNTMLWPTVLLFVGRYTNWFSRIRDLHAHDPDGPEGQPG
jgi:hypothetical protein